MVAQIQNKVCDTIPYEFIQEKIIIPVTVNGVNVKYIVDTGGRTGTMLAAYNLVKRFNPKKVYVNFLVELEFLKGRNLFPNDVEIESLIKY